MVGGPFPLSPLPDPAPGTLFPVLVPVVVVAVALVVVVVVAVVVVVVVEVALVLLAVPAARSLSSLLGFESRDCCLCLATLSRFSLRLGTRRDGRGGVPLLLECMLPAPLPPPPPAEGIEERGPLPLAGRQYFTESERSRRGDGMEAVGPCR